MGYKISIYTKNAFKEFILPSIKNADHVITLHKNHFQIKEDLQLYLEVLDGEWKIKKNMYYTVSQDNHVREAVVLKDDVSLIIHSVYQDEIHMFVKKVESSIHAYKKFSLKNVNELSIGKDSSNDICYNFRNMVSRNHAKLQKKEDGFCIINNGLNGVYVNSSLITESSDLEFGAYINILGLHMVYLGDVLAIDLSDTSVILDERHLCPAEIDGEATVFLETNQSKVIPGDNYYHRSPRNYEKIQHGRIEIEAPPEPEQDKKKSLFMSIGPSLSMSFPMLLGCLLMVYSNSKSSASSSLYMYSGLVMSVSSAIVGVTWTLINLKQEKKQLKEKEAYRFKVYSDYLVQKADEIKEEYEKTIKKLQETYKDASFCLSYNEKKGNLWNRNYTHEDFLTHRLGVGEKEFQYEIAVPPKKFTLYKDELAEKPEYIKNNYEKLVDVPITIDLRKNKLIGVVGGNTKEGAILVAKLLATQISANNCYTEVKLAFVYDNETSEDFGNWDFAKWLPHVWSEDKHVRYVASNKEEATEVFYELTKIFRGRDEESQNDEKELIKRPYYVVIVSNPELLEKEGFLRYALHAKEEYGLTTIILTDHREMLPNECEYIIENSEDFSGIYNIYDDKNSRQKIQFDHLNDSNLNQFARHLASLHVAELEEGGEIPNSITFFEMLHVNHIQEYPVREMWAKNKTYENIRGLLGQRAGGVPCYLDVHEKYHGPHGLVAGTTGSGKSETLQTYILSLAIDYSPDDIAFFIIDYKGGGMANLFQGLPHMIGSISNLSGNQVKRAMTSIKSENKRRQRVFTEHGVNNINLYTKLYKNGEALMPIPHLFIIIDEFAELKREEPKFMEELISVAQVGRSLGVHLILATQKPSGTVDNNIWSNTKFRLCLRVQDQQDSKDMLHKADAAYITQAGRGYLQVGNDEVYELFQSGFSGAVYDENMAAASGDIAKLITTYGKIDMTGNSVKLSQKQHAEIRWINMLCELIENIIKDNTESMDLDIESRMEYIISQMYQLLATKKIDYEVNEYNSSRLRDFIELYMLHCGNPNDLTKAESIIILAEENRKKLPQPKEKTQLDVTKQYLAEVARNNGYTHKISLWMPVLKEQIYLHEFAEFKESSFRNQKWCSPCELWNLQIVIGQVDDPENQSQMPITYDFAKQGHVAIIGSVVSGKSTFMQTMIYGLIHRYTPDYVNIYVLDYSSRMLTAFEQAPQVGGIMCESDAEKISKFFNMMGKITKERKELFKGGNYKQYVQRNGVQLPAIVLFIDNYAAFKEKTEQRHESQLIQLSKEGVSLGIYLVISGAGFNNNEITPRVGENMESTFCLALQDIYVYREILHNMKIELMPEVGIKGRGLAYYGSRVLEYQAALAVNAENDYQRMDKIQSICEIMQDVWTGARARQIPEIPEKPVWSEFSNLSEYQKMTINKDILPVAYDKADADVYGISLRDIFCYLITGESHTGKTNFMKVMIQSVMDKKAHVCILDGSGKDLKQYAMADGIHYATDEQTIFAYFRDILTPVFQQRNQVKNEMLLKDYEEEDIYLKMREEQPYFIFISDFSWFVQMVYTSTVNMSGFMETLVAKGRYHNIYFIAEISINKLPEIKGYKVYESFVEYKTGIHFGGNLTQNNIMPFEYIPFKDRSIPEPIGVGILPGAASYSGTRKIVVPLARK